MTATLNGQAQTNHLDLNAKRRAREAAAGESRQDWYSFEWGEQTFQIKPALDWPANAKAVAEAGDFDVLLDAVLDDPVAFWAVKPVATMADVQDLLDAWGQWSGVGPLGESNASQPPASTLT